MASVEAGDCGVQIPAPYTELWFCPSGCYAADQYILFANKSAADLRDLSVQWLPVQEAYDVQKHVVTLSPDATRDNVKFGASDVDADAVKEQKLVRAIEAVHMGSKKKYGSPKVHDRLSGLGFDVSPSTVARRMRKHGIKSKLARKFKVTTDSNHKLPVAPNLLMQDFTAYRPDQIWMSDITYVPTREGWLYVCGIIDLFSKKIVAWTASSRMTGIDLA